MRLYAFVEFNDEGATVFSLEGATPLEGFLIEGTLTPRNKWCQEVLERYGIYTYQAFNDEFEFKLEEGEIENGEVLILDKWNVGAINERLLEQSDEDKQIVLMYDVNKM